LRAVAASDTGSCEGRAHIVTYYKRLIGGFREFMRLESAAGVLLLSAAVLALVAANTALAGWYEAFLAARFGLHLGFVDMDKSVLHWINDGLMALFFLVIGCEIKRAMIEGELSSWRRAALPAVAAAGGMLVPALIYVAINRGDPSALRGWAIPSATDIAFAFAVISLLGKRVPASLRLFLLALAIIDDLGAIVIIAIFYTSELSLVALSGAVLAIAAMAALNRLKVTRIAPYALLGLICWAFVLKSGVHATLAGVATSLLIPIRRPDGGSPLHEVERRLHPWTSFLIMPLFGFANAGLVFADVSLGNLFGGVAGGAALGLFLGKQIGVFGASALSIKLRLCERPAGASWLSIYGVSILAGIGFTMSLFIGSLAWEDGSHAAALRLGVLGGSIVSAICGLVVLSMAARKAT
jgi:Na+:H+ antiporter, NhaA family